MLCVLTPSHQEKERGREEAVTHGNLSEELILKERQKTGDSESIYGKSIDNIQE